jgi:hypothetical protein
MTMALRGAEHSTLVVTEHDLQLACEIGVRSTIHIGL